MAIFKKNTTAQCLLALVLIATVISSCDAFGPEGGCFMPFLSCDLDLCRRDCNGLLASCQMIGEFHHRCCCAPKKLSAPIDKNSHP
ncbi:hypothetical protein ACQJBY_072585 [Aegilops geniculata]